MAFFFESGLKFLATLFAFESIDTHSNTPSFEGDLNPVDAKINCCLGFNTVMH